MLEYDVLLISDFRLPGGTNRSSAEELKVHRQAGIRTGLIQCNSKLSAKPRVWSEAILNELATDLVEPVLPNTAVRAKLAILRHPIAIAHMPDLSRLVDVQHALIIANQAAEQANGTIDYDPAQISAMIEKNLGIVPVWAPIGPVVRESLQAWSGEISILPENWSNIFASAMKPEARTDFNRNKPVIGRHSRPQAIKWPNNAKDIRRAYPTTDQYDVRVLGGAKPAFDLLKGRPTRWTIHKFGSVDPQEFLREIDFWVYFHHPSMREAYGRAVMEAMWSGAVAILPEYLRETFGDAAVYGTPADVREIIESFRTGERNFLEQSRAGQEFAATHSPQIHLDRLKQFSVDGFENRLVREVAVATGAGQVLTAPKNHLTTSHIVVGDRYREDIRPNALFITSNGAGMGHLTRMLGIAREVADTIRPVFFSMSQGVGVVSTAGFPYEYVPFNSALQTKSVLWHEYFEERLAAAIDSYNAQVVVFDGTWPYRGMLKALRNRNALKVWIRRGMWKGHVRSEHLSVADQFDLVIEPGDYASEYDVGPTSLLTNAFEVPPMTVLRQDELLSRPDALAELGLPTDGRKYALVSLGAGNINDISSTQAEFLASIGRKSGWEAVLTKPPIASDNGVKATYTLSTFPLSRYTRAFDIAVSAAGYNSYSEWMAGQLPTIWIPNMHTITDDQDARARWAQDNGVGLRVVGDETNHIDDAVNFMTDDLQREQMMARLKLLPKADGGREAAQLIRQFWRQHEMLRG